MPFQEMRGKGFPFVSLVCVLSLKKQFSIRRMKKGTGQCLLGLRDLGTAGNVSRNKAKGQ